MQLTAKPVDWHKLTTLSFESSTDDTILKADEKLQLGKPSWPSDSTMQVFELSGCYDTIKDTLSEPTRASADKIMDTLVHKSFMFPWELTVKRGDYFVGAISPRTVCEYLQVFAQINYAELDEAFDLRVSPETKKEFEIARYRSEDVFTGYLRQWEELFKYAAERDAGVLIHCG